MPRLSAVAIAILLASSATHGQQNNCGAIRAQIEAKIRNSGVASFTLQVVEAEVKLAGKVVGTCDLGTKKIVYNSSPEPASGGTQPKAKASEERILTDCKDGTVTYGECKK
jgi:hypothetical protein